MRRPTKDLDTTLSRIGLVTGLRTFLSGKRATQGLRLRTLTVLLVLGIGLASPAVANQSLAIGGARANEPIIVTGGALPAIASAPINRVFVFVYSSGSWQPIPFQVDELTSDGQVVANEDGVLDTNDEVVFMTSDLGDDAGTNWPDQSGQVSGSAWQQIEVTDPANASAKGYAYIVRTNDDATRSPTSYVTFDTTNHRINGQTYSLGYTLSVPPGGTTAKPELWFDYLTLGASQDLLDRSPKFEGCLGTICSKEQFLFNSNNQQGLTLVKQGPVRLILRSIAGTILSTNVYAYGSSTSVSMAVFSTFALTSARVSTDFNENAIGSTYYNAATTAGVPVDGAQDSVPPTPYSPWWQVSTSNGTVVQTGNIAPAGGTPENYYVDNGTPCSTTGCDTGDFKHYGDSGVRVNDPNQTFTYRYTQYFLPGQQANIGATYQNIFDNPLLLRIKNNLRPRVYIPLVIR